MADVKNENIPIKDFIKVFTDCMSCNISKKDMLKIFENYTQEEKDEILYFIVSKKIFNYLPLTMHESIIDYKIPSNVKNMLRFLIYPRCQS